MALEQLLASDTTLHAYPDIQVHTLDIDSDQQIGADQIWTRTDAHGNHVTGTGVTVAVIDTGIYYTHPDLGGGFGPGHKVIGGYDFFNNDSDPIDDNGHGTHVAGIIAASGGIEGVAPGASLLAYKVLGADGSGPMSDVIEGIDASLDPNKDGSQSDHVDVISMSLGGSGDSSDPICMAVKRAVDAGVVVVVAAGNSGPMVGTVSSPGVSPYALTVGAVDSSGSLANFSSRGPTADMLMKPDVSAPGVSILSTVPYSGTPHSSSTGYMTMSGTSMATPHVSGAAALLVQMHPEWTPQMVKSALVTGAKSIGESFWSAGAGEVWLPTSVDMTLFSSVPLVPYGVANGTAEALSIFNSKQAVTLSVSSNDWYSLSADGSSTYHEWSNISTVSPSSVTIASMNTGTLSLRVTALVTSSEGYFDGTVILTSGSTTLRVPFGFMILSKVTVHVRDTSGYEVLDPYGGVWAYSWPGSEIAICRRGSDEPAPPATFLLPSGQFSVHSAGHQLVYNRGNPYLLSKVVTLGRLETRDVWLNMTDAHKVTINLETNEGNPIYVKDFRVYLRYSGASNYSFDLTGVDYSIMGSSVFTIPHTVSIYLSDTQAAVGVSIQGLAYSSGMWDFMKLNWQHWYEYITGVSTSFFVEASADLQYLLAWEFPCVDSSIPSVLSYDMNSSSVYVTKYDIPGTITDPWCNWGTHRAMGGESSFYIRRDTFASLDPFFSGMTRTTIVSGVFSELYFPGGIFSGYFEREFYTPDYTQLVKAKTAASIFLPNRNFLTPAPVVNEDQRLGVGPFYPSVRTVNTNDSMVLFNPLLRDQWGSKIGGMSGPMMHLYLGGAMIGTYQLSEFLARPDAERIVSLMGSGDYVAKIDYSPFSELFNNVEIDLGFSLPSADPDPPVITGLTMPQRFVPGDQLSLSMSAQDGQSGVSVEMWSRAGTTAAWVPLSVHSSTATDFTSVIQTSAGDSVVDLMVKVTDAQGNYLNYTACSVAQAETPVLFDIHSSTSQVELKNSGVSVVLTGHLTDLSGNPLASSAGVPLELTVAGRKVGMILDEYVSGTTHSHDGSIRFDWILRPTEIFSSAGQTVDVTVCFDLGTYSSITRTFSLTSIPDTNTPPAIQLISPSSGSLIAAGTPVDLSITDDGSIVSSGYSLDGSQYKSLSSPWDISTSAWSDGQHDISVYAEDDDGANVSGQFSFNIDASAPALNIISPVDGSVVPLGSTLVVQVSDAHLSQVTYSLDGSSPVALPAPYTVDMSLWSLGSHVVDVTATDMVGHSSVAHTEFEIANSTVIAWLASPADGSVVKSGVPIDIVVLGSGTITCSWSELGISHSLSSPYDISTSGWVEGTHQITVSASNDIGGHYQVMFNLTVDDTPPSIELVPPPASGAFVKLGDHVTVRALDAHFKSISYTLAGVTVSATAPTILISLHRINVDGYFTVSVVACDLANNTFEQDFIFAMDNNDPVVRFNGALNGSAILPGASLNLTASDIFLSDVRLSVDVGAWQSVTVPYQIDTSQLALGWHTLHAIAEDFAGHSTNITFSIYIDGTPPAVAMLSGNNFTLNSSFTVSASPSDDYGIRSATLYFELSSGGFGTMPMTKSGPVFTATLAPDQLWKGMVVYVVVSDMVGQNVEGEHQTLLASAIVPPGDHQDKPAGVAAQGSWWFTAAGVGSMAIVVLSAFILLFYAYRRREPEEHEDEEPAPKKEPVSMSADSLILAAKKAAVASAQGSRPTLARIRAAQASVVASELPARKESPPVQAPKREAFSLLDTIPAVRARSDEQSDAGYKSFMAQLEGLKQEMTALQRKRSMFQEPEVPSPLNLETDLELDEPRVIRGLKLKSMLQ